MSLQPITLDGRSGLVMYLNEEWEPVSPDDATLAKVLFDDGTRAFYTVSDMPKILGGAGSGHYGHAGQGTGEVGGSRKSTGARSEKSRRALKAFVPVHAEAQRHAEENELDIRKIIGGERTDDNLPVDVVTTI